MAINNGPNSLHGGPKGFHKRVWDVIGKTESSIDFHYIAANMEEGFPGELDVHMTYTLTDNNEFRIEYKATTDKKTIVNLTNHAFFSLSGIGTPTPSVCNNILTVNADFYLPTDSVSIPTGEIVKVENTPMDFRTPHTVGERINENYQQLIFGHGYDHCYVLNKQEPEELSFAAKCIEPESGRTLEVYTTEPGLQVYTANWNNGMKGSHGTTYPDRSAICFEAQHFPDSPNRAYFPSAVLKPGEVYKQTTIYKFGVEKGRIGIFVGIFGMALLIGFLLKNFNVDANNFIVFFDKYYYLIIPITLIIVLVISYLISKKIYLKKEF